jgi:predicted transposase/invertase (TIGR01784 family)
MRFLNPKTDFAFKKIFGSTQSKDILINFLNAILYSGQDIIQDLTILDPYQAPPIKGIKDSFLDVKATLHDHTMVVIEMQVLNLLGFEKRVLYNAAKAFSIQLDIGQDYATLNPVIALTITDFEMFPHNPKVISRYGLKEKEDLTTYSDDIELVFVELPKFRKTQNELVSMTDKWIYFLQQAQDLDIIPASLQGTPAFEKAFQIAELGNLTRNELDTFERQQMIIHDSHNAVLLAAQKGVEQGIEQGQRQKAEEIARALLDMVDPSVLSQTTGLTLEELEQLRLSPSSGT